MAQRRFQVFQNDPNIARFVVEGTSTGRQLGVGSYGSVEEVNLRLFKAELAMMFNVGCQMRIGLGVRVCIIPTD